MEHKVPEVKYGLPFKVTAILNIVCFAYLNLSDNASNINIVLVCFFCALLLSYLENLLNDVKFKLIYIIYIVSMSLNLYCFFLLINLVSGQSVTAPNIFFVVGLALPTIPGYLLLKLFENIINKKLHKDYWRNFESEK